MSEVCIHVQGDGTGEVNQCDITRQGHTRRNCWWCTKNTTRNDGKPTWPERPPVQVTVSAKPKLWPKWAASLRTVAIPADVGTGDTAAREIAALGMVGFEVKHNVNFGPSCGCGAKEWSAETRAKWNERWAYAK